MRGSLVLRLGIVAVMCGAKTAHAKHFKLTLEQALALARERAPEVVIENSRVPEVAADRTGASVLVSENPEIDALGGRRRTESGDSSADIEAGITQMFETGGQRGARIAAADAAVASARSRAADAARRAQLAVAVAFLRALHGQERVRLAEASAASLEATRRAVERRAQKGEVAALEVNLAKSASVRARAAELVRQAEAEQLRAAVGAHLGLLADDTLELVGAIEVEQSSPAEELQRRAAMRSDVAALTHEERAGRGEERLGRAMRWPDLGLRVSYAREGEEDVVLGGLVIRLPLFRRGQEVRAGGRARTLRARVERRLLTDSIARGIQVGSVRRARLERAVALLRDEAIPVVEDSERLLARSVETGLIGLGDYLAARRELLGTREEYLDRLLDLAIVRMELELGGGGQP